MQRILQVIMKKRIILGTSDTWSLSHSSQQPSDPAYYIEDCRIYVVFVFTGRYEDTLLHAVAERGHSSIFKLILNEVVNKNPKGHFADTPLHFAAEKGHTGKIV